MFIDSTVIPSYLNESPRGVNTMGHTALLTNYVLRVGEVIEVVPRDSERNVSKLYTEFTVLVQHRDGDGVASETVYRGVSVASAFGNGADFSTATYRAATESPVDRAGNGSKVLVLCVNGDQTKAVIIGGLPVETKDASHHFAWKFNGFSFGVNEDGEAEWYFRGKTKIDGTLDAPESASGSMIRFAKDGSVIVQGPGGDQYFKINHDGARVELRAGELQIRTDKSSSIRTTGTMTISATRQLKLDGDTNVVIGAGDQELPRFSTYRQAEQKKDATYQIAFTAATAAFTAAATALTTAAALNAVPMVGGIAAAPFFVTAATQLGIAATAMNNAYQATAEFESKALTYTSRHKND